MSNGNAPPEASLLPLKEALYCSRIEVERILLDLKAANTLVFAELDEEGREMLSHVLHVDGGHDLLIMDFSHNKSANTEVLARPQVSFHGAHRETHVEFLVGGGDVTSLAGRPALRFHMPEAVRVAQRRANGRIRVPDDMSLRCIADGGGVMPFEAHITDISLGGMGTLVYEDGVRLAPGTVLRACRVILMGHDPVTVDLEVRHTGTLVRKDGSPALRSGVRFIDRPAGMDDLIRVFVRKLD